MLCSNCGKQVKKEARFCKYCGVKLKGNSTQPSKEASVEIEEKKLFCPKCNTENPGDALVCMKCGGKFVSTVKNRSPNKEKSAENLSSSKEKRISEKKQQVLEETSTPATQVVKSYGSNRLPTKLLLILLPSIVVIGIVILYITNVSRNVTYYNWMIENKDILSSNTEETRKIARKMAEIGDNMDYRARNLRQYTDPVFMMSGVTYNIFVNFVHTEISDFSDNLEEWEKQLGSLENIKTDYSKYHPTGLLANQYSVACSLISSQISCIQEVKSNEEYIIKSFKEVENSLEKDNSSDAITTGANYLGKCLAGTSNSNEIIAKHADKVEELAKAYIEATDKAMARYKKVAVLFKYFNHKDKRNENLIEPETNNCGTNTSEAQGYPNSSAQHSGWTVYNTSNSGLPSNDIRALAIEGSNIWIGTNDGGLAKFDGTNWTVYNHSNSGLPNNSVNALAIERTTKWIGTGDESGNGGLAKFDGTNWTVYDTSNSGLNDSYIQALAIEGSNIWIGSGFDAGAAADCGLTKYNGTNWIVYETSNSGLPDNFVNVLAIEGATKWIGTSSGLVKFDGNNWTVYNHSNSGLPSNDIRAIAIQGSNIWIGTVGTGDESGGIGDKSGGGLAKFDGTNWTVYNHSNSGLPDNGVISLATEGSNIWIGTDGLAKFDGTNWTVFNTSNSGLPNNDVFAIAIEGSSIWIGTIGGGLAKFNSH